MRTRRSLTTVLAATVAAASVVMGLMASSPASAMSENATPDGDDHPAVVALLMVRDDGRAFAYCSGMLISPTVVLTASHCNEGTEAYAAANDYTLAITNDPEFTNPDARGWVDVDAATVAEVTTVDVNPAYRGGYRDDVSVQLVEGPPPGIGDDDYGVLPTEGLLDSRNKDKTLRGLELLVLGYGTEVKSLPANTGPAFPDSNQRRRALLPTITLTPQWIKQSQSVAKGLAGACYGDSGGPSILEVNGRNIVVGVTSTGDGPCFATNVASRVDTAAALAYLRDIPGVPS